MKTESSLNSSAASYADLLRIIGVPGLVEGENNARFEQDGSKYFMQLAELNKIGLLFSYAIGKRDDHFNLLKARHELLINTIRTVGYIFGADQIKYSIFKTIKPFPTTPSDVDALVSHEHLHRAIALLEARGYRKTASDAYSATLEKEMIVDLQLQPSVSNLPYLPASFLMQYTTSKRIGDSDICSLGPEAEVLVIACHSIYKEQMLTLNDYYAITILAEQLDPERLIMMAEKTKTSEVLKTIIGICANVTESVFNTKLRINKVGKMINATPTGFSVNAFPIRFPTRVIAKLLLARLSKDAELRRRMIPALIRVASPSQLKKLNSHLRRRTY